MASAADFPSPFAIRHSLVEQGPQPLPVGRIGEAYAQRLFELVVPYAPVFGVETLRHRAHAGARFLKWDLRRWRLSHEVSGEGDDVLGWRRLVVGEVERACGASRKAGIDRLGNVGHMDAVEHLARLDDAPCRAL